MRISDELSKISANALAEKKREQDKKNAARQAKEQAEKELLKKERKEARRIQQLRFKQKKFASTIRHELFLKAWDGNKKLFKSRLNDWQIEALTDKKYRVLDIAEEHKKLTKTINVDLPKAIKKLLEITQKASDRFLLIKKAASQPLSQDWRGLDTTGFGKWLDTLKAAFHSASITYGSEVEFRNKKEERYLARLRKLDTRLQFIKKNIGSFYVAYRQKLDANGLSTVDSKDPDLYEKTARKKTIVRFVLEEQSNSSWGEISDAEIHLIFHAVHKNVSLTSAASFLTRDSFFSSHFDDDEVINLLADFPEKTTDDRPFEPINSSFEQQATVVEHLIEQVRSNASSLDFSDWPLGQLGKLKGFVIYPTRKCADFQIYDFLVGSECKKFKSEMEQQMRSAAQRGDKSISLQGKKFREGIELKSTAIKKVFLPFDCEMFLVLVSADGLGYEVFEESDFRFTMDLLWN